MTSYRWIGKANTDFGVATNWFNVSTGTTSSTVPGLGDIATFYGSGAVTGTGTVSILNVYGAASNYTINGTFTATRVVDRGSLTLSQGSLLTAHVVNVGSATTRGGFLGISNAHLQGMGTGLDLNVSNGIVEVANTFNTPAGTLSLGNGIAQIGVAGGGSGSLYVAGLLTGGSKSAILVGNASSTGTLNLEGASGTIATTGSLVLGAGGEGFASLMDGGTITVGNGTGASLVLGDGTSQAFGLLQGANARITVRGQAIVGDGGQATLSLTTSFLATAGLAAGDGQSAQGSVTLQGSRWIDTGSVAIGGSGFGMLTLEAAGKTTGEAIINGALSLGGTGRGEVLVSGSALQVHGLTTIGAVSGSNIASQAIVEGAGHWNSANETITLEAGSGGPFGPNALTVTGTGSTLSAGLLSIGAGAQATVSAGAVGALGSSATSQGLMLTGTLAVSSGASVAVNGSGMVAGTIGTAALLSLDGGTATLTATANPALTVTSGGTVSLSGSASTLTASGGILALSGTITTQGGTINATATGGNAAVNLTYGSSIDLEQGTLNTNGLLLVGGSGGGGVQFESFLSATDASITSTMSGSGGSVAAAIGASNSALVHLVDTGWTVSGSVNVGSGNGTGSLLTEGGHISISQLLAIGGNGSAGVIITAATDTIVAAGTLTAGQTGIAASDITVTGNNASISTGSLVVMPVFGASALTIDGASAKVSGNALLAGKLDLLDGGTLTVGTLTGQDGTILGGLGTNSPGPNVLNAATIATQGSLVLTGALVANVGSISGNVLLAFGTPKVSMPETLTITGQAASSATIAFTGAGTLVTPSIADLASKIDDWQSGAAIDYAGTAIASLSYANGTLSLFGSNNTLLGKEAVSGTPSDPLSSNNFSLATDNHGGTLLLWH